VPVWTQRLEENHLPLPGSNPGRPVCSQTLYWLRCPSSHSIRKSYKLHTLTVYIIHNILLTLQIRYTPFYVVHVITKPTEVFVVFLRFTTTVPCYFIQTGQDHISESFPTDFIKVLVSTKAGAKLRHYSPRHYVKWVVSFISGRFALRERASGSKWIEGCLKSRRFEHSSTDRNICCYWCQTPVIHSVPSDFSDEGKPI
jgi:hypothetical protein